MLKPGLDDWMEGVSDIQDNFLVVGSLSLGDGEKMAAEAKHANCIAKLISSSVGRNCQFSVGNSQICIWHYGWWLE